MTKQHFTVRQFIPADMPTGYRAMAIEQMRHTLAIEVFSKLEADREYVIKFRQIEEDADLNATFYTPGAYVCLNGYIEATE